MFKGGDDGGLRLTTAVEQFNKRYILSSGKLRSVD